MSKLKGKIALVTGASRGIGRSIAMRLARDGAVIAVHYGKSHGAAEEVVHEIQHSFDILVNNAGIGQAGTIEETTEESFDEVMNIHLKAPLFLIQQALPRLKDEGRIINISSAVTRLAFPNLLGYSVSK